MQVAVFRWKAAVPLLAFGALGAAAWLLFAERIARRAIETVGTAVIGAKVEIRALALSLGHGSVAVRGLTVASPFRPLENLLQADELVADLDLLPLLEKKVVIDRLAAKGLKFATPRATDGRTRRQAGGLMDQVEHWGAQLRIPALQLAHGTIGVGRLDPAQLYTPRAASALRARADSELLAWGAALRQLDVAATADSAKRMIERLRGARPVDLTLLGDARRTLDQVRTTRARLDALHQSVAAGIATLQAGVAELDDARRRDYAFARGLLKVPSLEAPDIGAALFGAAAIERFQRALYWAQLTRRYMPPGLLPRAAPGPKRVRRAGTTVRFPRERAYPAFLLRSGEFSFQLARAGGEPGVYAARLSGLTSDPALYGQPTTAEASAPGVRAAALIDHVRTTPRDTAGASLAGVGLPGLTLPALPIRLEPGPGTVTLGFAYYGDSLRASWGVKSDQVRWVRDTTTGSELAELAWRVVSGVSRLEVVANLAGTLERPRLAVSSNLDRALSERIRAVAGEEIAAAERRLRVQVDSLVEKEEAAARAQVAAVAGDIPQQLGVQQAQLEQAQRALEQRLKELTRLPGVRLP